MNYGFLIDNRKCIGCHACTTACKSENQVPIGVNRTWVKYVEKGEFPNTRRFFQVTRCNHCEHPPCVEICPVTAMYKRADGIVEFDGNQCIGCKACMQACPYDAIYLDPATHTAAKCHYCSHRVEVGLEPACVVVCPVHAIVAGDLDDKSSEIATLVAREPVRVRKPEQGTRPKLFYLAAEESAIVPTAADHTGGYMWSQPNEQLHGGGAIRVEPGRMAQALVRATYDVGHERPWGWPVPLYLVTKSVAAGVFVLLAPAIWAGYVNPGWTYLVTASLISLIFTALTTALLVLDLGRPERFFRVVFQAQLKSWLARGAFILMAYSVVVALVGAGYLAGLDGLARTMLLPSALLAVLSAVYTAFLFGQCEGRDLWQSPILAPHLIFQAMMAGGLALALIPQSLGANDGTWELARMAIAVGLLGHLAMTFAEFTMRHTTDNARYAARLVLHGPFKRLFWGGAVGMGMLVALLLLMLGWNSAVGINLAGTVAVAGLMAYEWCYIMAGQGVPNS